MPPSPFGEHLKRERELRGVSLDEVSAATRISTRFLEALENGRWSELPGGAFNRGFIRAAARFLGLNEDAMVAEYALETKEQNDSRAAVAANEAIPRDLRPLGIAIAVVVVLLALIAYGFHRLHVSHLHKRQEAAAAAPLGGTTAAATGSSSEANTPSPNFPTDTIASRAKPAVSGSPISTGASSSTPSEPAVLELKLQDEKSTHVKVLVDGKKVFEGRVKSKPKIFHTHNQFEITSSDVTGLSMELDGKSVSVPSASAGRPFVVSRSNLPTSAKP